MEQWSSSSLFSPAIQSLSSGACSPRLSRAWWILTMSALARNLLSLLWSTHLCEFVQSPLVQILYSLQSTFSALRCLHTQSQSYICHNYFCAQTRGWRVWRERVGECTDALMGGKMHFFFRGDHKQKFYWGHKEVLIPGEGVFIF